MPKHKKRHGRLSVFKGREARLNKAIFHTLALKGPQTIYAIHKIVRHQRELKHVRYASVNKRIRALESTGYIRKSGVKKTLAGFEASIYDLTAKAYLAVLLDSIKLDDMLTQIDEAIAQSILAAITYTM